MPCLGDRCPPPQSAIRGRHTIGAVAAWRTHLRNVSLLSFQCKPENGRAWRAVGDDEPAKAPQAPPIISAEFPLGHLARRQTASCCDSMPDIVELRMIFDIAQRFVVLIGQLSKFQIDL